MAVNYAIYQIVLYDDSGNRLAIIDDYRSLQFQKSINAGGFFTLIIDYNDSKRELFVTDSIIQVMRKIPGRTDWYVEFEGHCENFSTRLFPSGNYQYIIVGSGFCGLLSRRIVAYNEAASGASKNDASETVMKEYVLENISSDATIVNGRIAAANITTFSVEADAASGATWDGDRSGKNLLEILQEIARFSSIDFDVETNVVVGEYIFNTFVDQLGADRTTSGLDTSTGLNAAGNAPHIFSPERGNVQSSVLNEKHRKEVNRVYTYGKGSGATRAVRYQDNLTAQSTSAINLREAMRGAGSQNGDQQLDDLADEWLEKLKAVEKFEFVPQDIDSSLYGVHYFFGDKVTVKIGDTESNKRIVSITISLAGGAGESNKRLVFEDI